MKSTTIHNLEDDVSTALAKLAKENGMSLNKTIKHILAEYLGTAGDEKKQRRVELQKLCGEGNRYKTNLNVLERFHALRQVEIVSITRETASIYGLLISKLREKGRPTPLNDVWLAAQAMEHGAVVATFDKHFDHIDGVRLWEI